MNVVTFVAATLVLASALPALGQEVTASTPTPLSQLLAEAEANNPQISGADHEARAARQMAPQAATLPDPKFTFQQFSVGSPKPFAGYTNSDFAYVGIGATQDLPYPGKLRLRGQVAERDADAQEAEVAVTKASIADAVKADYIQLAYLQQTLGILSQHKTVLDELIQDATAHYKVGEGMLEDVLEVQIDRTKIVREITMHHREMGRVQANLKGLLNRDQGSPDIVTEDLSESPLKYSAADLLGFVRKHNPQLQVDADTIEKQNAQLKSARRDGKPDFELGYMYENTDRNYRDYYMLSFNITFPRRRRVEAEIAEAQEKLLASRQTLNAHAEEQLAQAQQFYVQASSDEELLKEYREGLVPQSDSVYRAALSAYASNKEQLSHVLNYFTDLLNLNLEYAQTVLDHETALVHLESLTGVALR